MTHMLRFMGVNRDTQTAGPGKRLEFFTKGCIRGVVSPCQGCFNESTWTFAGQFRGMTTEEVVNICKETSWNRQVTFCGGEPILQAKMLTDVAKQLKEIDPTFHFVMYTAYKLDTLMKYGLKFTWVKKKHGEAMINQLLDYCADAKPLEYDKSGDAIKMEITILQPGDVHNLMRYIDLIVDGDYQMDKRLTTSKYMHEGWFIGSSNQRVINAPLSIQSDELIYIGAAEYNEQRQQSHHCKCCGHDISKGKVFCNQRCANRFSKHTKDMQLIGGV